MNLFTIILLDMGSDPVIGFVAVIGTIVVYLIRFAIDPKSAEKGMGNNKYNKSRIGMHNTRNRKNAERRRNRQVA